MTIDDQLAALWAAGASFTDMALKLGETRNAIAGRIDRARARGDARFAPRPPKPKAAPKIRRFKSVDETVGAARPLRPPPDPQKTGYWSI